MPGESRVGLANVLQPAFENVYAIPQGAEWMDELFGLRDPGHPGPVGQGNPGKFQARDQQELKAAASPPVHAQSNPAGDSPSQPTFSGFDVESVVQACAEVSSARIPQALLGFVVNLRVLKLLTLLAQKLCTTPMHVGSSVHQLNCLPGVWAALWSNFTLVAWPAQHKSSAMHL